jgi:hypothetical protein
VNSPQPRTASAPSRRAGQTPTAASARRPPCWTATRSGSPSREEAMVQSTSLWRGATIGLRHVRPRAALSSSGPRAGSGHQAVPAWRSNGGRSWLRKLDLKPPVPTSTGRVCRVLVPAGGEPSVTLGVPVGAAVPRCSPTPLDRSGTPPATGGSSMRPRSRWPAGGGPVPGGRPVRQVTRWPTGGH